MRSFLERKTINNVELSLKVVCALASAPASILHVKNGKSSRRVCAAKRRWKQNGVLWGNRAPEIIHPAGIIGLNPAVIESKLVAGNYRRSPCQAHGQCFRINASILQIAQCAQASLVCFRRRVVVAAEKDQSVVQSVVEPKARCIQGV